MKITGRIGRTRRRWSWADCGGGGGSPGPDLFSGRTGVLLWQFSRSACFGDPGVAYRGGSGDRIFDKELRVLVKDLTDAMTDAPGAGLAAPRDRVSRCEVFTYNVDGEMELPINPDTRPVRTTSRKAQRAPVAARTRLRHQARVRRRRQGLQHVRRPGRPSKAPSCCPAASSTRPTTWTALLFIDRLDREQRKLALKPSATPSGPVRPRRP
ncbi:hypothetical protein ACU686_00340 [Yinghuangia aomiensis]